MHELEILWTGLFKPMLRLLLGMSIGLLLANILEALRWTKALARLAYPLARVAHLSQVSAAAFSTAFISPAASNGLLAEQFKKGQLSQKELILSNVFNSLPLYLTHAPSLFFLTWPVLGFPACIYVGLTLVAAFARTFLVLILARIILPKKEKNLAFEQYTPTKISLAHALQKAWARFKKRVPTFIYYTVPIYILVYILQQIGFFALIESWLIKHASWIPFVETEALGIVALHLAAELGMALSAAGAIIHSGALSPEQVAIALLVGNVLSTPIRAIRHQFPSYAGFFTPKLAFILVLINQSFRAISLMFFIFLYAWWIG